jgi:hypothetical protein
MSAPNETQVEMSSKDPLGVETARPQSYDDEDAGDAYHDTIKGYTRSDKADMSRMGKIQELRVNRSLRELSLSKADDYPEKLPTSIGSCLHRDHTRDVGGAFDVRFENFL